MGQAARRFFLRVLTFLRAGRAEAELSREIQSHLQLLEDKYIGDGMSAEEARYAARRAFGGVEQMKEQQRDTRTFRSLLNWKLDVKLGLRMLAKYPGLSLVSVIGMAMAIAIATGYFAVIGVFLDSKLPLEEGDRIVAIRYRIVSGPEAGDLADASGEDFLQWRDELKSVRELGAFKAGNQNLFIEGRRAELVEVVEMTASGFQVARVAPMLGRPLLEQDERADAPPVLVIGYNEWQRLFHGDENVLGQMVRIGETAHTIVGVMPKGFEFPIYHSYWVPLRVTKAASLADSSHQYSVFGRLVDGASLTAAQAEMTSIGDRMARVSPQINATLRPQVFAYPRAFTPGNTPEEELAIRALQYGIVLLLVIVAANVAVLVYARTATRMGEIAVRTALGASRGRIVTQLFVEGLVLSGVAAAVALTLLRVALVLMNAYRATSTDPDDRHPFWMKLEFSPSVFLYVAVLAVLAALIVGALPALKATGKRVHNGLQQFSARSAGMQLGRTWTMLIVLQVATAVAVLPAAMFMTQGSLDESRRKPGAAANDMIRARLAISRQGATLAQPRAALMQRLKEEAEVASVTFADRFPGREAYVNVELEDAGKSVTFGACTNRVAPNLFEVFDVPVLAGRSFAAGDERPGANAVIVDQTFADHVGGGSVIGRRIRYTSVRDNETVRSEWHEIVGVVPAFTRRFVSNGFLPPAPRLFHAAAADDPNAAALIVRTRGGGPAAFAPKLIDMAARVDANLRLERLEPVAQAFAHDSGAFKLVSLVIVGVVASVLLLSAAGIYAMMSFTVNSRRREIGIRAALGANARHVLFGVFRRAGAQLGAGVIVGIMASAIFDRATSGEVMGGKALVLVPGVIAIMVTVGLLAAVGPARRSLAVEPAEALRDE